MKKIKGPILIAEDDADDQMMMLRALKQAGVTEGVKTVWDGEELVDFLNARGKYAGPSAAPRPAVILLDLNMPRLSGREALSILKSDPRFRPIPVIVFTTSTSEVDIYESYEHGANAYIVKPATYTQFAEITKSIVAFWLEDAKLPLVKEPVQLEQ